MTIVARYYLSDLESKDAPMAHHKLGLQWTRSGYGRKIPTTHMVRLPWGGFAPGRLAWRRVYVCCYSNAGTAYVETPAGDWIVIED